MLITTLIINRTLSGFDGIAFVIAAILSVLVSFTVGVVANRLYYRARIHLIVERFSIAFMEMLLSLVRTKRS